MTYQKLSCQISSIVPAMHPTIIINYGVPNGSKATVPFERYFFTVRTVKFSVRTVFFTVRTVKISVRTLILQFERYFYRSNAIFYRSNGKKYRSNAKFYRSNGKISVRTVNSFDPFPIPMRRYCSYTLSNQKSACISVITGKLFAV